MSDPQSVWPDGAREAVEAAHDRWIRRSGFDPTSVADDILTALEPFVQQRIAQSDAARLLPRYEANHKTAWELVEQRGKELASLREALSRYRQERDDALALAESRRLAEEGARETLNEERVERSQAEQILADVDADRHRLRREVARLREDGERRQAEVLQLRALVAALPIGECQASAALQGWWDQMKAVMAGTNPVWLVEPRGCPTPGACSCPGVRLDAARSAPGGEG